MIWKRLLHHRHGLPLRHHRLLPPHDLAHPPPQDPRLPSRLLHRHQPQRLLLPPVPHRHLVRRLRRLQPQQEDDHRVRRDRLLRLLPLRLHFRDPNPAVPGVRSAVNATFSAANSFVGDRVASGIDADRAARGAVSFNIKLLARVQFRKGGWRLRRRLLRVLCRDVPVTISNNGTGMMTGGGRECGVAV
ncbi:hypothetical protein RchiOBHm_Chr5g0047591 [Rosa chinensis]|uniref:Uncharacterized protein n=1 Tax=Rosa chinensis TaxID=74649 RepID=A0A2P6QEG5_ROSCH|nr:hypothetical protein RchiOBHm_Chr5g0047591 [Rosa chinensis]